MSVLIVFFVSFWFHFSYSSRRILSVKGTDSEFEPRIREPRPYTQTWMSNQTQWIETTSRPSGTMLSMAPYTYEKMLPSALLSLRSKRGLYYTRLWCQYILAPYPSYQHYFLSFTSRYSWTQELSSLNNSVGFVMTTNSIFYACANATLLFYQVL